MLFHSPEFLFVFLPLVMLGFVLALKHSVGAAMYWLLAASLCFYAYWKLESIVLLCASFVGNYWAARAIVSLKGSDPSGRRAKYATGATVAANLVVLGIFKYTNFFISVGRQTGLTDALAIDLALPLGISFFTLTQIAFLVDAYRSGTSPTKLSEYALFVTFFPHLLSGPIYHHAEMVPQFRKPEFNALNIALGLSFLSAGLVKKVLIADPLGVRATRIFDWAEKVPVDTPTAWIGTLAYTLQIYFDFSGYSDMAIGLALLFGIRVPANFNSPYKATSMIEFWQRWHMTLSRFLRDYLLVPLGGLRKSAARRYVALFVTMVLAGVWHGAGWTFVVFGALHGAYLVINHVWRGYRGRARNPTRAGAAIGCLITFLAVMVSLVLFRAVSLGHAGSILAAMMGLGGAPGGFHHDQLWSAADLAGILVALAIVWAAPNTLQLAREYKPALIVYGERAVKSWSTRFSWRPTTSCAFLLGIATLVSIVKMLTSVAPQQFLYFQF